MTKHKDAYVLETVLDRAISTKVLIFMVSLQSSHANLPKKNVSPKMAAILKFEIFCKSCKTQK